MKITFVMLDNNAGYVVVANDNYYNYATVIMADGEDWEPNIPNQKTSFLLFCLDSEIVNDNKKLVIGRQDINLLSRYHYEVIMDGVKRQRERS